MKHIIFIMMLLISINVFAEKTSGQANEQAISPDVEDKLHDELRAFRDEVVKAFNSKDIDKMLSFLDENVIFIPMNGETCHGHDDIKNFYEKMMNAKVHVVKKHSFTVVVDKLTQFYGNIEDNEPLTGFSSGVAKENYELNDGLKFDIDTKWSATVIKINGKWKVKTLQFTANVFDNPILKKVSSTYKNFAIIVSLIGTFVGLLVGKFLFGKKAKK